VALPLTQAFKLSLAKLFIDQALPSAGISGTLVAARALERSGIARPVVMAAVVVDTASYYAAYVLALAVAMVITIAGGHTSPLIIAAAIAFTVFGTGLSVLALVLSGRAELGPKWLYRVPLLKQALGLLSEAEPMLVHRLPLIAQSGMYELAIILLDAASVWTLIRALGQSASPSGVFASFMVSTLLRTISIIPGGLGAFEAASVLTLRSAGVPVSVGLGATLLFRGLSFWLPMLPGLIFSRAARGNT
jgi:Mg2+-importing ATPase